MDLTQLKQVEKAAYPHWMRQLQHVGSARQVAEYAEVSLKNLRLIQGPGWYAILGIHKNYVEICDFASETGRVTGSVVFKVIREVLACGRKTFVMDCRETSYALLMALAQRRGWRVEEEESWPWGPENMTSVTVHVE